MRRKKQILCLMLTVLVFLSGIWCENSITDFQAENVSVGADISHTLWEDDAVTETQLCMEEMLGVRIHAGLLQLTGRLTHLARKTRVTFDFLYSDISDASERKFFAGSEEIYFSCQCPEELVVNYIHQSDGKKRI